jgi:molecular chaperone GrpE
MSKEKEKKQTNQNDVKEAKTEEVNKAAAPVDPETVPYEDYKKIMEQFEKALATIHHLEDLNRYYKAEYDKANKYRSQVLSELLLNSLDGFQLAFKSEPTNEETKRYRSGFEFVYKFIKDALTQEGVSEITPKKHQDYDPKIHAAIESIETEDKSLANKIAEVMINGYMLKDRLLRAANVKIYVLKDKPNEKVN